MSKLRSIRTLGILFALMAYLFSITTLSPAGAETASIPVTVTASPTVGLVDGQAITVTVTAGSSPIYGVEARQCWAAGSIDYTADFSPTVSGKCAATALGSAGADVFQSVTTIAPHSSASLTFKVGKGSSTFTLQSGAGNTVVCNGINDCKLTLLLQVTGGTVFKSIPFGWTDSPPATPGQPTAVAGAGSAAVTVVAPTSGGTPTSYTVTASPGTAQCTVTGASGSCTVNGLTNGTSYTFTSTATNVAGTSSSSVASAAVTPGVSGGARFNAVTPVRILDTRTTLTPSGVAGRVAQGGSLNLQITGANGIPNDATAVVMNVTAVSPNVAGYVTVYPNGVSRPEASNLNFVPGDTVPNLVIVGIGSAGKVNLFNANGTVDLIADIVGYYSPDNTAKQFFSITPVRALDTRNGTGGFSAAVGQGASIDLTIRGANGIPNTASAIVMNTTAVLPTGGSFLTVWPTGVTQPLASNLNFVPGDIIPNLVQVGIGSNGKVSLFNNAGAVNLVADLTGYFA